jgi:hypothetical protein
VPAAGIPLTDILTDSGYAYRDAGAWAFPLRLAATADQVTEHDRQTAELGVGGQPPPISARNGRLARSVWVTSQ